MFLTETVPKISRLQDNVSKEKSRSMFIAISNGVGGQFDEVLRFANNSWMYEAYRSSNVRRSVLLRGFIRVNYTVPAVPAKPNWGTGIIETSSREGNGSASGEIFYDEQSTEHV